MKIKHPCLVFIAFGFFTMAVLTILSFALEKRPSIPFDENGEYIVEREIFTTVDNYFLCMAYGKNFSSEPDAVYHLSEGVEVPPEFVFFEKSDVIDSFHSYKTGIYLEKGEEVRLRFTFKLRKAWYGVKYDGVAIEKIK